MLKAAIIFCLVLLLVVLLTAAVVLFDVRFFDSGPAAVDTVPVYHFYFRF